MHIGLRTFFATMAVGLALAPAAGAFTGTETLLLARDGCGGKDDNGGAVPADNTHLGWNTSGATNCGNLASGLDPVVGASGDDYPTAADVASSLNPIVLDGTRSVHIEITVNAFYPLKGGLGNEQMDLTLTGVNTLKKNVTLGSASSTKAAQDELTGGNYTKSFDVPIPAGKDGAYKALNLNLSVGGAEMGGFVMTDGTSFISLPIQSDTDAVPPDTGA